MHWTLWEPLINFSYDLLYIAAAWLTVSLYHNTLCTTELAKLHKFNFLYIMPLATVQLIIFYTFYGPFAFQIQQIACCMHYNLPVLELTGPNYVTTWLCPCVQCRLYEYMVCQGWSERTRVICKEPREWNLTFVPEYLKTSLYKQDAKITSLKTSFL